MEFHDVILEQNTDSVFPLHEPILAVKRPAFSGMSSVSLNDGTVKYTLIITTDKDKKNYLY